MKYIGFKHQRENKQNSDEIIKDAFLKPEDVSQSSLISGASTFDER
jgi:hypothetical protein